VNIGDRVYVKIRPYHWHGNGCVGIVEDIDKGEPSLYVVFANGHSEFVNIADIEEVDFETTITACDVCR
jgi:hypothetical protein